MNPKPTPIPQSAARKLKGISLLCRNRDHDKCNGACDCPCHSQGDGGKVATHDEILANQASVLKELDRKLGIKQPCPKCGGSGEYEIIHPDFSPYIKVFRNCDCKRREEAIVEYDKWWNEHGEKLRDSHLFTAREIAFKAVMHTKGLPV
jgi:hypothetical protein